MRSCPRLRRRTSTAAPDATAAPAAAAAKATPGVPNAAAIALSTHTEVSRG